MNINSFLTQMRHCPIYITRIAAPPLAATPNPKMNSTSAVPVRYVVYSDERVAVKFPGFICAKWRSIHRVTMNFIGQTVIVPEKIPIDTTASECYKMINTKKCEGYEMTLSDEKYVFSHEP
ncbi:hypothetical protein OUZ56_018453 [Daphnia magna]|uniref:Uncharacterized protein n=1 Tax=Daphnia magna TaxID=35525 RepID=A0ABQ9Z8X6_9CRUS|nr:hypothetical protein OUZ56_018453 [Daphnia magna]